MSTVSANAEKSSPAMEKLLRRIDEISTLPQVALKVMEVANDPDSGAADLKNVLESDAALSARVLRCVNSSAYAVRTRITNLQQAIAYLGLKQVRNLAMTASVSELFKKDEKVGPLLPAQPVAAPGVGRHLCAADRPAAETPQLRGRLPGRPAARRGHHPGRPARASGVRARSCGRSTRARP